MHETMEMFKFNTLFTNNEYFSRSMVATPKYACII